MNWGGLSTQSIQEMYDDAIEFLKADARRHEANGRQVYAKELKYHLEVIEERVRRQTNTVKALMPMTTTYTPKGKNPWGRKGMKVKVGEKLYPSMTAAAKELGCNKHTISRMIRDGEAQKL